MSETTYTVRGMTCDHCVRSVKNEVGQVAGVTAVDVELDGGLVTVTTEGSIDDDAVRAAVEEAGFEMAS